MALEHTFFVSSFHAVRVDPDTGEEIAYTADSNGAITAAAGDIVRFKPRGGTAYASLNSLMLHAFSGSLKIILNDNKDHALLVPEGDSLGITSMAIYSLTLLEPCSFRYEGLG